MKIKAYFADVYNELVNKVSWPSWSELQSSATIVMIASVIIAIGIFVMDFSFRHIMDFIYSNLQNYMAEIKKRWYVLRVIGGKEKKVKEYIENEVASLGLQDYVSQVLIPTEKIYQVRNGKKISKERNFFPGYVMIEAALVGEIPHMLRDITNVIGFLGETKGGDPVPMRQSEINRILGTVDELSEQPEEINIPYVVGESVKVTDGPFNGFTGVIEEVNNDKKRVKVIVKVFGRQTPLELSFMQVEKE